MSFYKRNHLDTLYGLFFVSLFAVASLYIANLSWIRLFIVSPLMIAVVLGMILGNTLYHTIPSRWVPGIQFSIKQLLQLGIMLYGFRITFQEIYQVGMPGLILDIFTIISVFFLSLYLGVKLFKLDRDTAMLIGTGSAICGAAAVLAAESVLKSDPSKSATAVGTVVLFGTTAIFLYPVLHEHVFHLSDVQFGIYAGGTVHEVGQVLAIGNALTPIIESHSLIVKMTRVMLLAPFLMLLGFFTNRGGRGNGEVIPWFAIGFIAVCGFNSLQLLTPQWISFFNHFSTFLLAMAMSAIGMQTNFKKVKQSGLKAISLGASLFIFLMISGYFLIDWMHKLGILKE